MNGNNPWIKAALNIWDHVDDEDVFFVEHVDHQLIGEHVDQCKVLVNMVIQFIDENDLDISVVSAEQ